MTVVLEDSRVITSAEIQADRDKHEAKAIEAKTAKDKPVAAKADVPDQPKGTDDVAAEEDEIGLTVEERQGLTAKMLKAIGKKHRAQKEAEEFAANESNGRRLSEKQRDEAEKRASDLQKQLDDMLAQARATDPDAGKPQRDKFATEAEYQDALTDWKVDKRIKERDAEAHKRAQEERQAEILANAAKRIAKAEEMVPDFRQRMEAAEDLAVHESIAGYMQESEMFGELALHLAEHPEDVARLLKLTPARQLVEIGKIESKLSPFAASDSKSSQKDDKPQPVKADNGAEPSKTVTPSKPRAAVITPLSSSLAQVDKDPLQMSTKEVVNEFQKKTGVNLYKRERH